MKKSAETGSMIRYQEKSRCCCEFVYIVRKLLDVGFEIEKEY